MNFKSMNFKEGIKCPNCQKTLQISSNEIRTSAKVTCPFCHDGIQLDGTDFNRSENELSRKFEKELGNLSIKFKL